MPRYLNYEAVVLGGVDTRVKFLVPRLAADPSGAALVAGLMWFNTVNGVLRYYDGSGVIDLVSAPSGSVAAALFDANTILKADTDNTPEALVVPVDTLVGRLSGGEITALTVAQVRSLVGVNKTYIDSLDIDAETLGGSTAAQLQTAITAAIVDAAPGTLDTLNELAAALGDDPNFAATITASIATKASKPVEFVVGNASSTVFVITHNLNTRGVAVSVYRNASPWDEVDVIVQKTSLDTITVIFEGYTPGTNEFVVAVTG